LVASGELGRIVPGLRRTTTGFDPKLNRARGAKVPGPEAAVLADWGRTYWIMR